MRINNKSKSNHSVAITFKDLEIGDIFTFTGEYYAHDSSINRFPNPNERYFYIKVGSGSYFNLETKADNGVWECHDIRDEEFKGNGVYIVMKHEAELNILS